MKELRCDSRMHGRLNGRTVEFKCDSKFCGARPGVAVLHLFHTESGALLNTQIVEEGNTPK